MGWCFLCLLVNGGIEKYIKEKKVLAVSKKRSTFAAEFRFIRESRLRSA